MKELAELREARAALLSIECGMLRFPLVRRDAWERWHAAVEAFNQANHPSKEAA